MTEDNNSNPLNLAKENDLSTFSLYILATVTLGFFIPGRISKISSIVNNLSENKFYKIKDKFFNYYTASMVGLCSVIFLLLMLYFQSMADPHNMDGLGTLISILMFIFYIIAIAMKIILVSWSFSVKKCLDFYALKELRIPYKLNSLLVILFDIYYVNYCVNNIGYKYERFKLINNAD